MDLYRPLVQFGGWGSNCPEVILTLDTAWMSNGKKNARYRIGSSFPEILNEEIVGLV